jgi:hypothetical protein
MINQFHKKISISEAYQQKFDELRSRRQSLPDETLQINAGSALEMLTKRIARRLVN